MIVKMAYAKAEATFLISPETGRALTFGDLKEQVSLLSAKLQQLGLTPGDKVAFLMDNGLFTATLFLASMYGRFVAVPLNVGSAVCELLQRTVSSLGADSDFTSMAKIVESDSGLDPNRSA